jgi:hypothetical protein
MKKLLALVLMMNVLLGLFAVENEEWIIQRLDTVPDIVGIQAVTEDNDPNGNLNKTDSACIYFESKLIDQSEFDEKDIVGKGTSCGGCIELYPTVENAVLRNEYLGRFDGTFFDSGSHVVYNCMVIRTSSSLTASQQKELEKAILFAFK